MKSASCNGPLIILFKEISEDKKEKEKFTKNKIFTVY